MTELEQLASHLGGRGLVMSQEHNALNVSNPVSSALVERVHAIAGAYVTGWGYEVGQIGDEKATANRVAFLLGVPSTAPAST